MSEHLQQKALFMFEQTEMFVRTFFYDKAFFTPCIKWFFDSFIG